MKYILNEETKYVLNEGKYLLSERFLLNEDAKAGYGGADGFDVRLNTVLKALKD